MHLLKHFPVDISGPCPVTDAIVTAGGVKTKEIDPKTMESKAVKGDYTLQASSLMWTPIPAGSTCRSPGPPGGRQAWPPLSKESKERTSMNEPIPSALPSTAPPVPERAHAGPASWRQHFAFYMWIPVPSTGPLPIIPANHLDPADEAARCWQRCQTSASNCAMTPTGCSV